MAVTPQAELTREIVEGWWRELGSRIEALLKQAQGTDPVQEVLKGIHVPILFSITFSTTLEDAKSKNQLTPPELIPVVDAVLKAIVELDKESTIQVAIDRLAKQSIIPFYTVVLVCRPDISSKPRLSKLTFGRSDDRLLLKSLRIKPD